MGKINVDFVSSLGQTWRAASLWAICLLHNWPDNWSSKIYDFDRDTQRERHRETQRDTEREGEECNGKLPWWKGGRLLITCDTVCCSFGLMKIFAWHTQRSSPLPCHAHCPSNVAAGGVARLCAAVALSFKLKSLTKARKIRETFCYEQQVCSN